MKRKLSWIAVIFLIVSNLFWFVFACYAIRQIKEERAKKHFYQNVIINGAIEKCGENGTVIIRIDDNSGKSEELQ